MATSKIKVNDKYVGNSFVENLKTTFTNTAIPAGKTANITLSNSIRSVMSIMANNSGANGQYHVNATSTGVVAMVTVKEATSVAFNIQTSNRIVITNNSAAKLYVNFMVVDGSVNGVEIV